MSITILLLQPSISRLTMVVFSYNCRGALGATSKAGLLQARRIAIQSQQQLHTNNTPPLHPTTAHAIKNSSLGIIDSMARKIRQIAPVSTETYRAYTRGKELYLECARQAAYLGEEGMSERARFWYLGMHVMPAWDLSQ